ncbi:MAG: cytochrome-c peroxidase [Bacteroidia bacterium]
MKVAILNSIFWGGLLLIGTTNSSCQPVDPIDSFKTTAYDFNLNQHFADISPEFDNTPEENPTTVEGVELGRHLFYDVRLSKNNTISCASCHKQENAFTDPDRFSVGFEGKTTARNSMSIVNMRWQRLFFWDARAQTLEEQVLMPIQDHIEMGMALDETLTKIEDIDIYPDLFELAFGDKDITSERISFALAQFVRTIISQDSKFDEVFGLPDAKIRQAFTAEEYLGYQLFTTHVDPDYFGDKNNPGSVTRGANCGDCHLGQLMTNNLITNNGLDLEYSDNGYGDINSKEKWDATFKTPTLRNIELTAPYMHDGRFETLEEVVEHYDEHVKEHKNLDFQIEEAGNHLPGVLHLTEDEKKALVAFLKTLTDYQLINDPKYANPF